jgi:predicted dehydrogenase
MARKLKVGIVGANWTLNVHAPAWRMLPDIEVAAICTSREETARAAATKSGIERAYWNVAEMVADPDLDIIDIGTKPVLRYDMVMMALAADKHVYNCLPFATDLAKAEAMRDAARSRGLVGAVDAQWRWTPAIRRMKEMIDEGAIGRFFTATIHLQMPLYAHDGFVYTLCAIGGGGTPYPWLAEESSGASAWRNFGSHTILCLMYLFGEIEEIVGVSDTFVKELHFADGTRVRPQTPDFASALLRFRNGGTANINVSWAMADAPGFYLEVCGSNGRLVSREPGFCDAGATLYHGEPATTPTGDNVDLPDRLFEVEGTNFSKTNLPPMMMPISALFSDMARVIRTGAGDASPSFADAAHAHAAVEAAVRSERTGRWERVKDR